MVIAWLLDRLGVCPIVKRIWTPSWTLWSGGICFLFLGSLHAICDVGRRSRWGTFWKIIGANSILAYAMSWTLEGPIQSAIERHFGWLLDRTVDNMWRPFLLGAMVLAIFWSILAWLYRKRLFVRI